MRYGSVGNGHSRRDLMSMSSNVFKRNLLLHLHNKRKTTMDMEVGGFLNTLTSNHRTTWPNDRTVSRYVHPFSGKQL